MTRSSIGKVLISGASIAGPTLAYWLNKYGFDVSLVERSEAVRHGGYPVDVCATALDVVGQMGILPEIKAAHVDTRRAIFLDLDAKPFAVFRPEQLTGSQQGRDLEVPRGALTELLYRITRHDIDYRFSESISALTQQAHGVRVTFASGATETFDFVFGADGLHSNTRKLVFGPEVQFERYLGYCFGVCTMRSDLNIAHESLVYTTPGKTATLFSPTESKTIYAFLNFKHARPPDVEGSNTVDVRRLTAQVFADGDWEIPKIVDAIQNAEDFFFDTVSQIHMPSWSSGRVALTGDAAHATSCLSGQGTSLALIGAYVLAGELASHYDYEKAFDAYERVARSYIEANQALAPEGAALMIPETEEALANRNRELKAVIDGATDNLRGARARPVINSFRLPDYTSRGAAWAETSRPLRV